MANILLIDDDASMRSTATYALSRKGHMVFAAETGKEASLKFGKARPDLIITDFSLPQLDEIQGIVQAHPSIPVILISGDLGRSASTPWLESAIKLEKPFSLLRLLETVSRALAARVESHAAR